jgi:lysophospholipase L1-like esterase
MLIKLALAPCLLWQGRQVRRQALRLPEAAGARAGWAWPPALAPDPGAAGLPGPAAPSRTSPYRRLLVVGDSSAAGVGVGQQAQALAAPLARALARHLGQPVGWQLLATTGHTAADALQALGQAELQPADWLVTALGVNDVVGQTRPRDFLAQLQALHEQAQARAGVQCSFHSALPPMGQFPLLPQPLRWVLGRDAQRLDQALQAELARWPDRSHVPLPALPAGPLPAGWLAEDGFHPGPLGYPAWVARLAQAVLAHEASAG